MEQKRKEWELDQPVLFGRLNLSKVYAAASPADEMKGWHWLYDRFLSLTSATLAQLSAMLIPFYFPPSHPAHTSPCTFCCPCFYTLSHGSLPLLSALPPLSFIPRSPSARTPILSACYSSHTPAQTSLMLIYVTRYSWVDTILKQEN